MYFPLLRLQLLSYTVFVLWSFLNHSLAVCIEQTLEVGNLYHDSAAYIGVAHLLALAYHLYNLYRALNVGTIEHCLFGRRERSELHKLESTAMVNQRVPCNTCTIVVYSAT